MLCCDFHVLGRDQWWVVTKQCILQITDSLETDTWQSSIGGKVKMNVSHGVPLMSFVSTAAKLVVLCQFMVDNSFITSLLTSHKAVASHNTGCQCFLFVCLCRSELSCRQLSITRALVLKSEDKSFEARDVTRYCCNNKTRSCFFHLRATWGVKRVLTHLWIRRERADRARPAASPWPWRRRSGASLPWRCRAPLSSGGHRISATSACGRDQSACGRDQTLFMQSPCWRPSLGHLNGGGERPPNSSP